MEVRIFIETTFEDGNIQRRDICRLSLVPDKLQSENVGLCIVEAKNLLRRLQEAVLQGQIDEAPATSRICDDCTKPRAIHDDRGRIVDMLYGRFRVKAPRLRQCVCNHDIANTRMGKRRRMR